MERRKRIIVSDLGNVVFRFDPYLIIDKIKANTNWRPQDIFALFSNDAFLDAYEKGQVSSDDFLQHFISLVNLKGFSPKSLKGIWNDIFFPVDEVVQFYRFVKENGLADIVLLSNISELHYQFLIERFSEIFDLFSAQVLSYKVGARKPERKIFDAVLSECGDSELVYIDDREDFIYWARYYGLPGMVFKDFAGFLKGLRCFPAFADIADIFASGQYVRMAEGNDS